MFKRRIVIIIGIHFLLSFSAVAQTDWTVYEFKDHNSKIKFFQKPVTSVDSSIFNDSPLLTYTWDADISDSTHVNVYYGLSEVLYPATFIHADSSLIVVEGFINSSQTSILTDTMNDLLSSTLIEKNGYPGKEFKWRNKSTNMFFEFQVFLIQNKLVQLSVTSRNGKNHNKFIDNYFDSFETLNISKGNFTLPKASIQRTIQVEFPNKPKEEVKIVDSALGKLNIDIQMYESKGKDVNLVYVAMETKYPSKVADVDDTIGLNIFYKNAINGTLNSVNGELISMKDIYYYGKLGKELRCYFSGRKALMVYRYYYIEERMFCVGVITLPESDKNKEMNNFFSSFKILK